MSELISKPLTIEDAIDILKNYDSMDCLSEGMAKRVAMDMAIEALKNQIKLNNAIIEISKLNPVDYGSMFSYETHDGARDMKTDVLYILYDVM